MYYRRFNDYVLKGAIGFGAVGLLLIICWVICKSKQTKKIKNE